MTTYERLIELLAQLVADNAISEEDAAGVLLNWRELAGLDMILPLPMAAGIQEEEPDDDLILAILIAALGAKAAGARRPAEIYARLAPRYRRPIVDRIQDYHAQRAADLAADLAANRISVSEWQRAVRSLNQSVTRTIAELGAGRQIGRMAAQLGRVQMEQAAYLQRFAEQIAAQRLILANPLLFARQIAGLTVAQIAARTAMYTGAARALYFQGAEMEDDGPGWVVRYEAVDDNRTCSPCSEAEGYYLPGDGPWPGEVCAGEGNCRCARYSEYSPEIYARLTGIAQAARRA